MMANIDSVEEKRLAALEEVEGLLQDIVDDTNRRIGRVRQNLVIAKDELLNGGEYNYCVRLALRQMKLIATEEEAIPPESTERIHDLREGLEENAALPPQEDVSR